MDSATDIRLSTLIDQILRREVPDPAGVSLDESGEVDALQRMSMGTPETEVAGQVIPGRPADWPSIEEAALKLLDRSVDIRLVILLAEANLRTGRLAAFADGLATIASLVRDHWEHWYPRTIERGVLDVEERESALAELRNPRILSALRAVRPFSARQLRASPLSDVLRNGDMPPPGLQTLRQALSEPGVRGEVERTQQALDSSVRALRDITEALEARSAAADFSRLMAALSEAASALGRALQEARAEAVGEDASALPAPSPSAMAATTFTRDSAKLVLQALIDYFGQAEPSSPVPLYLTRAKSLIGLTFEDALKEMGDDVSKFGKN
jgi:type VI secretion system protein ImpA